MERKFDSEGDISLHPSKHSLSDTCCGTIRVARTEATIPPREVSKEIRKLRMLSPVKVPNMARSGWKRRRKRREGRLKRGKRKRRVWRKGG